MPKTQRRADAKSRITHKGSDLWGTLESRIIHVSLRNIPYYTWNPTFEADNLGKGERTTYWPMTKGCMRKKGWKPLVLENVNYISREAKCIVVTAVCVYVGLWLAAFRHYCTNPDVTWRNGRGALYSCALLGEFAIGVRVSLLWQHSPNTKCQRVLVLVLCLILLFLLQCISKHYHSHLNRKTKHSC